VYNACAVIWFSLFGIQVRIHPSIWVTLALMAYILSGGEHGMLGICLFVLAGFFCLFAHEMGHALSGKWLGGGRPSVDLAYLGGVCTNNIRHLSAVRSIITTAAGPGTALALTLPVFVWFCVSFSCEQAWGYIIDMCSGVLPHELLEAYPPMLMLFLAYVVQVSIWWSLLNLLPIYPLDGGIIMHNLMRSPGCMHIVSMAVAGVLAVLAFALGLYAMVVILMFLIFYNYHGLKNSPY